MRQTYDNYYRDYYKSEKGRLVKQLSQQKYRRKLAKIFKTSQDKAVKLNKAASYEEYMATCRTLKVDPITIKDWNKIFLHES